MKLMLVSTWLLVYLTACGQASKGAGSYQTVSMWIAFQLDIQAYNADSENWKRTIAPGLSVTASFDQFLKYILVSGSSWPVKPTGLSAADVDISTIDVTKVATALNSINYPNTSEFGNLLPGEVQPEQGVTVKYHKIWDPIFKTLQDVSDALGKTTEVTAALAKITDCWAAIVPARVAENRQGMQIGLSLLLQSKEFQPYKLVLSLLPNGDIDFPTTLRSAQSTPSAEVESMFTDFQKGNYDALLDQLAQGQRAVAKAVKGARGHAAAIANSQKYLSKAKSMC